jgi:hypothetical protein
METIHKKSQAELNSQAMAFAAYEHETSAEREEIVAMTTRDLGSVATNDTYPQYLNFLRSGRGTRQETIRKRTELQNAYDTDFKPTVDQLKQSLEGFDDKQQHEAFIGAGTQANVFVVPKDGKEYVVRALKYEVSDKVLIDRYIAGTLNVQGNPHFEHIVAASYDDEVTVAERMPGKRLGDITSEEITQVSDDHLRELINTLKVAQDNNIKLDTIPANYMYDKNTGFGLIDLDSTNFKGVYGGQELGDKIALTSQVLLGMGEDMHKYTLMDTDKIEYYQEMATYKEAQIGVLRRFSSMIEQADMPEKDRSRALDKVNQEIDYLQQQLRDFTDPERVNEQVERATERARQSQAAPEASAAVPAGASNTWEIPKSSMNF